MISLRLLLKSCEFEPNQVAEVYLTVLRAERELVATQLKQESERLDALKGLRKRGHASWLEVRKQRLKTDQIAASQNAYDDFLIEIESRLLTLTPVHCMSDSGLERLAFTELFIESPGEKLQVKLNDLAETRRQYQEAISQKVTLIEKLKRQTQSLAEDDPWKRGFQNRLAVAEQELEVVKANLRLTELFDCYPTESSQSYTASGNWERKSKSCPLTSVPELVKQSLQRHCQLHGELLSEILEVERERLEKLKFLKAKGMVTQRDFKSILNRVSELNSAIQSQFSIAATLNSLFETTESERNTQTNVDLADLTKDGNLKTWQDVTNRFSAYEARAQFRTAQLEKEMLNQVLERLEEAWTRASSLDPGRPGFSNSLRIGQQEEIGNYRRKIRLADLQSQLAFARLQALLSQNSQNCYSVSLPLKNQTEITNWIYALSPYHLMSINLDSGINAAKSAWKLNRHLEYGLWSNYPTRFQNLDSSYRPLKLNDFSRPIRLSYRSPLSRRSDRTSTYLTNRTANYLRSNSHSNRRDYGSVHSPQRRSLRTFERAYQNGIIKSEYRRFLNPGQPPWYLPGSPTNLSTNQLRTSLRDTTGHSGYEPLNTRAFTDLGGR